MGWTTTIESNRQALIRIVAALFTLVGLGSEEDRVERLTRARYRVALRVLRPAESALRRLIAVAAQGIAVKAGPVRQRPARRVAHEAPSTRRPAFRLFDARPYLGPFRPRRRRLKRLPRIAVLDGPDPRVPRFLGFRPPLQAAPPPPLPPPDDTINAQPLCRRLQAIKAALEDLPAQAQRLARWQAKPLAQRRPQVYSPLRPGRPPGSRKRPSHEVDHVLKDCQRLAYMAFETDTS
jgi:hypothetical protein